MPRITAVKFRHNDHEYELQLSLDDEAIVETQLSFEITASCWPVGAPNERFEVAAAVSIEPDAEQQPILNISIGEWRATPIPLRELYADTFVEQMLEAVPTWAFLMDPIIGCLVRSGISATVGQVIECNNRAEDANWFVQRARAISHCLGANIVGIGLTAAFRAGCCTARCGL